MSTDTLLATPEPIPSLNVPTSSSTVKVSAIDSTTRLRLPMSLIVQPDIKGKTELSCPAFSFLIEHSSGRTILFDLGVQQDWENMSPWIVERIKSKGWTVTAEKNVVDILKDNGVDPERIEGIIWSHYHWDHTGNPATFPASTDLIVGPGFKENHVPAWPKNPKSPLRESYWEGRNLREISFTEKGKGLKIGRFNAMDFFGDGSFYLLDTPGHAIGHMAGLARVTTDTDTFVLMGGDACHHGGEFRPTRYKPLPAEFDPCPVRRLGSVCPGSLFQQIQPKKRANEPFYTPSEGFSHDAEQAEWTIRGIGEFDAQDNVLVAIAHDETLLDTLDFFPKSLNDWKEKDFAAKSHWRFLKDFEQAIQTS